MYEELKQLTGDGYISIAYQLQALIDKSPEVEDDLLNLATMVIDEITDLNAEIESLESVNKQLESQLVDSVNEGFDRGYAEAEREINATLESSYNDGHSDGYNEGYQEGYDEGYAVGIDE